MDRGYYYPNQQNRYEVIVWLPPIVPNVNREKIKDELCIYFQSKQGGDCDVECIRLVWEDSDAEGSWYRIFFVEQSGASKVLAWPANHAMVIDGTKISLEVQCCQALPGTSVSPPSEVPPDSFVSVSQNDIHKDTETRAELKKNWQSGDKTQLQMTSGASWDTQKRTSHNTASFSQHGATQQLSPERKMKVDPANQASPTRQGPLPSDAVNTESEDIYGVTGGEQENLQDDREEDEQLIEVTGLKRSTDHDFLKLYFESNRKSGGGEIETMERDSKSGAIRITFMNPSVAAVVARRKHNLLSGATLKVKLIIKKKRRPLPVNAQCLFLEGIPDGCSSEHVTLFIEDRASMDEEPTVQYGEKPGTAICTFSHDIPDLEDVIRRFSQRKLKDASLKAEKVHHSDAILVQGVPRDLEMVELYFDNKKKSGGNGVKDVQPGPVDGQAIVYFEDWKVVQDVVTKGHHKIGGNELQIESYHDFLGRLSLFDAPTPHIPKPVSVEVQEPIMEFLYGKGKNTKRKLLKELTKVKANLQWPDGSQKSQAKLEPVKGDSQHQSWLNWEKEAVNVLTDFMKGCKTATVPVQQSLWKDASDRLKKMTTNCSMVQDDPVHEVILVGEQKDVDNAETKIDVVIKALQKEVEYNAEQVNEDIYWDTEKLQLFTLCGIKQEIEKSFPALKITVFRSDGKTGIKLDGIRKTIKEVELNIRRMMDSLEKTEFKARSIKVQFVRCVPDKIHEVLGSQDILAACSGSDDGKITIHGATSRDVREAKAYIDHEIDEDMIAIKGQPALAVVESHDGKRLLDSINNKKFVMACISHERGARLINLAGFKRNLDETKKHIMRFLKENVILRSTIPSNKSKIRLITTHHGQELENVRQQHQKNRVAIKPQMSGRNRGFIIMGNEEGLEAVRQLVTSLVEAVKEKQYPVSKTGMARLFREEKGKKFLERVEKEFQCVITTDSQEESDDDEEEEEGVGHTSTATRILYSVTLPNSTCRLRVCQGDLTRQRVDCIVNAANIELKHIGGLAAAVLEAGGNVIQTESDGILKQKKRKLHVGEAVLTSSGNLPCKKVVHVAGPIWQARGKTSHGGITTEEHQLFDAIISCLQLASKQNFQSIAIPAISTGVYGFPVQLASMQILNAVDQFVWTTPNSSVTEISLTNNDQPTCDVFKQAVANRFPSYLDDQAAGTDVDTMAAPVGGTGRNRPIPLALPNPATETPGFTVSGLNVVTLEGMTIKMTKGSIALEAVDVIVNTAGSDMNLSSGKVSQAISQAAGPTLQQECNILIAAQGNVASWLFVETGAGRLACKKIYHCVCEGYKQFQSEQLLKKLVVELMLHASRNGMTSMAIPALGTGNLKYPPAVTARCMYEAAFKFSIQHPNGSLKDVHFVVYDKDMNTIKGFEVEIQRLDPSSPGATGGVTVRTTGGATGGAPGGGTRKKKKALKKNKKTAAVVTDRESYSELREDSTTGILTNIGSVCLQVQQGDLVRETTHAIVNSVGKGLDLQGPVSQAILKDGGESLKRQCESIAEQYPHDSIIYVTGAGLLRCKSIVHVVTPKTPEQIKAAVAKVLQLAEKKGIPSLSFPALGTGKLGQSVDSCADIMLKAIGEFACREKPKYLRLIRLVIYQREMLPIFQKALKKEVGQSYKQSKGLLQRGVAFLTKKVTSAVYGSEGVEDDKKEEELQETLILQLCALDMNSLMKASDKLDSFQEEEFLSRDFPDELGLIDKMTTEHKAELNQIGRKHDVNVTMSKGRTKFIHVEGCKFSVKDALLAISQMFTRIQKEETEKQKMEHLSKEVKWKYSTSLGMEDYDEEVNAILEEAYQKKRPNVTLELEDGSAIIDFQQMQETLNRSVINVHRVDLKSAAKFETPSNWIPMKQGELTKMVKLTAGTAEYTTVETKFRASMGMGAVNIIEIERIQNQDLIMQYQARRTALENRLSKTNVEMDLYHGTDEQTSKKISSHGFNRSFCGKNATAFGNGTYFAVAASYSAHSQYAKPDANGTKHIFVTKVLVGDYIRGSQGMITPPNKPQSPGELYDSVVDNINSPGIYVIFHDAQAYPEYLIKFQ